MRWFAAIFGTFFICSAFSWYMYKAVYLPRSSVPIRQVITKSPTPPPAAPSRVPVNTPEPIQSINIESPIETPFETIGSTPEPEVVKTDKPETTIENSSSRYIADGPVNIREKPHILGKIILVAPNNSEIELLGETNTNDNYKWEKVRLPYGDEGWVVDKFLTNEKIELKETLVDKVVTGSRVNIRSLPTTKSTIINKATSGTKLKVFTKPILHQGFKWVHVYLEDGQSGWAAARFLSAQ